MLACIMPTLSTAAHKKHTDKFALNGNGASIQPQQGNRSQHPHQGNQQFFPPGKALDSLFTPGFQVQYQCCPAKLLHLIS